MTTIAAGLVAVAMMGGSVKQNAPLYIGDLIHETPQFTNAPDFSLQMALNGQYSVSQPEKITRKTKKQRTKELVDLLQELYPDATIVVYQDHIFVR